jgi:anaerobic dimethyl sulfoxide reductase subunit B (iron-sulfur subunit)
MQYGFYHDSDICIGCNCCVIACKDKNDLPVGEKFRRVIDYAGCDWKIDDQGISEPTGYFAYSVSMACMHCASPACVGVCPTHALTKDKDTGIVSGNPDVCIGCGYCVMACPFGAPFISKETKTSRKCDLCKDFLAQGEDPACVGACPMRCLIHGDINDLRAQYGTLDYVAPLPSETLTEPCVVFHPSRLNPEGKLPGEVLNAPEELESATLVK